MTLCDFCPMSICYAGANGLVRPRADLSSNDDKNDIGGNTRERTVTQILFFATKEDLLPIFEFAEASDPLKYARTGRYALPKPKVLLSGASIPELGTANNDSSIGCDSYLILSQSSAVAVREMPQTDGSTTFIVDQLINPDSVTITAGGIRKPSVLLHGRVATSSDSTRSQELMKLFDSAFRKQFRKVKPFWVGNHALAQLERGTRLTVAVSSPSAFDLKL